MGLSYGKAFIDMAKWEAITIIVSNGTWMDNCFGLHFFFENPRFCARPVQLLWLRGFPRVRWQGCRLVLVGIYRQAGST